MQMGVGVVSLKPSNCKASCLEFLESSAGYLRQNEKQGKCWNDEFLLQTAVYQAPGSGRARRDAAARAMQGWHAQRLMGYGEVPESAVKVWWDLWISIPLLTVICCVYTLVWCFNHLTCLYFLAQDKNFSPTPKREKNLKNIGMLITTDIDYPITYLHHNFFIASMN